jgi:GNAT superfamily N-acetyltransferase
MEISRPDTVRIVALDERNAPCIRKALARAIYNPGEKPLADEILEEESLLKYHESWGKEGDFGYAAVIGDRGAVKGVCWCRLFKGDSGGFGYIDDETPELSIAVWKSFRGQGIGARLIDAVITEARSRGYGGLSLSVHKDNRCVALYQRKGFKVLGRKDDAYTMFLNLNG